MQSRRGCFDKQKLPKLIDQSSDQVGNWHAGGRDRKIASASRSASKSPKTKRKTKIKTNQNDNKNLRMNQLKPPDKSAPHQLIRYSDLEKKESLPL